LPFIRGTKVITFSFFTNFWAQGIYFNSTP
jgi:hypothetical protein